MTTKGTNDIQKALTVLLAGDLSLLPNMMARIAEEEAANTQAQLQTLEKLNDDIDQLASEANDCRTLAPKLKRALDLAWFLVEDAMRDEGRGGCGHVVVETKPYCPCCAHYAELRTSTQILLRHL